MGGCFGKGALLPGDGERTPAEDEYRVADAEGEGADLVVDSKSASSGEEIPDENYDGPPSTAAATAKGKASSSATAAASKNKKAGPAAGAKMNSTVNKPRARSANPTTSAGGGSSSASARVVPRSTTPSPIAMVAQLTPAWIRGGGGRPRDADLSVILPPGVQVDPPSGAASSSATAMTMSRSRSASAGAAAGGASGGTTGGGSSLRQATAKAPKVGASGGSTATSALSDGDSSTRQMFDRNTLRLMPQWAPVFSGCLAKIRKTGFENFFDDTFAPSASSRSGGEPKTTVAQAIATAAGTGTSTSPNPAKPNEQTGGSSASSSSGGNKASVRIFCRKRPLFQKERDQGHYDCIHVVGGGSATAASLSGATQSSKYVAASVCNFEPDLKTPYIQHHGFVFDHAFDENATNDDVFRYFLEKELFFSSFSAPSAQQGALGTTRLGRTAQQITTLFMLGQTGSGKTHTMTAIEERAAVEIFKAKTNCKVTFVELRGNKVFDLLYKGRSASEVSIREVSGGKYLVQGAEVRECNTAIELQNWMKTGHDRRKTEQTGVNDTSSRSHAVITITMQPFDSKLILVDAAGTERAKDQMAHSKERLEETAEINASIYALKECIRQHGKQEIPSHLFRQSTLTKLLADSFQKPKGGSTGKRGTSGANAGTSALDQDSRLVGVIVTVSPNVTDVEHSLTTLRAGFGMKNPKNSQTHSVKQVNLKQFLGEKELRFIAVNRWTAGQVEEWVGSFNTQVKFPGGTTGTMLSRFPLARFEQTFGKKLGAKMFASVKAENETPTIFSYEVE